jgi:3-oxoacyl-[acyl-carrier-protein] synthase III
VDSGRTGMRRRHIIRGEDTTIYGVKAAKIAMNVLV